MFRIDTTNINGLKENQDQITDHLQIEKPAVLALCET